MSCWSFLIDFKVVECILVKYTFFHVLQIFFLVVTIFFFPSLRLSFDSVYASFFSPCVNILNCVVRFIIHFLLWLLVFVLVEKDLSARLLKLFFLVLF